MAHVNVPKFGEWETEDDIPYTDFFDKARIKKKFVKMNTSNSPKSPSMLSDNVSPVQATSFQTETKSRSQNGRGPVRAKHVRSSSLEDGDLRRPSGSSQHRDTVNLKDSTDSPLHKHGTSVNSIGSPKRATKQSVGSDRGIEDSPLHPHHQAKVGGKGSGMASPSWERKGSTERGNNLAPLTPGKSRLRSVTQGTETPDQYAAVPKFGEWDESDPRAADGYSHIFNQVREEKLHGTGNVSAASFGKPYSKYQKPHENKMPKRCCCFPW